MTTSCRYKTSITNFFKEDFKERALAQATNWFHYMDETLVTWPHGPQTLQRFLDHLNGIHRNMQFIMEVEKDGHFPFLDTPIGDQIAPWAIRSNLYQNPGSNHRPSNKQAVLATLVHRVRALCDKESLHDELVFLKTTFRKNKYSFKADLACPQPNSENFQAQTYTDLSCSPAICPDKMLAKHIKSVGLVPRKISSFLHPVKRNLGLKTPSVYGNGIPCECGQVYTRLTGQSRQG
jgi:hypothetical protein